MTQQYLKWSPKNAQNVVQTLLSLEKSQFFSSYVWTFWSKYIKFCMDLDTFIILCRGLLLPEFLSNRLQTLAQ